MLRPRSRRRTSYRRTPSSRPSASGRRGEEPASRAWPVPCRPSRRARRSRQAGLPRRAGVRSRLRRGPSSRSLRADRGLRQEPARRLRRQRPSRAASRRDRLAARRGYPRRSAAPRLRAREGSRGSRCTPDPWCQAFRPGRRSGSHLRSASSQAWHGDYLESRPPKLGNADRQRCRCQRGPLSVPSSQRGRSGRPTRRRPR